MASDPLLGTVVDRRYRVVERIGTGGMGSVYMAEHTTLGRKFALKVLRQEFGEQPEFLTRFLRESRAATSIDHPNVIEVVDTGTLPDERAYYVMEHLQGEDLLRTLRREGRLTWPRVRHIALQICDALGAAHGLGIIHRDLKPANCFRITRAGDPDFIKLLDFGIVKLLGEHTLTGDGTLLGTTHYMAPEQAQGLPVDHRADIYALGVMIYQMLSGRHPFPGRSGVEMLYAILHEAPVPLRDAVGDPGLSTELVDVVAMAMQRDRDLRFAAMADLAAALRAIEADPPTIRRELDSEEMQRPAEFVGPSHPPTMARAAAPEPSFESKVTTDRPAEVLIIETAASQVSLETQVADVVVLPRIAAARARRGWTWVAALVVVAIGVVSLWPGPPMTPPAVVAEAEVVEVKPAAANPEPERLKLLPMEQPELRTMEPEPEVAIANMPAAPAVRRGGASDGGRGRKLVETMLQGVRQKIQKSCYSRLTVETVEIDVWIEARTGAVRRSQVAPPHDRTSTRGCVERVFAAVDFPRFVGKDHRQLLKVQIRPKA